MQIKSPRLLLIGALLAGILPLAPVQAAPIVSFSGQGTGPLLLVPEDAAILSETIDLAYTPESGFQFDRLFISDSIDTSATDPESTLFDTYFALTAADGSGLYGTFAFTSGEYLTPTYEVFAGTFHATSGTGAFAGYTGSGTFDGFNVWSSALTAESTMTIVGLASIPEPATLLLLAVGATGLIAGGRRRRHA